MKELSIEEKARRYDEAVINGSRLWESDIITRESYEYIFPELKESEDEKIRKYMIKYFEANKDELSKGFRWNGITVEKCIAWLEKQIEQKPAWSEEDERNINEALSYIKDETLKTFIKNRVQPQPKQEWSEEDEEEFQIAIDTLAEAGQHDSANWLKSLKERYTWKPSLAQMNALSIVSKGNAPDDIEAIVSLYNDLKKLREE